MNNFTAQVARSNITSQVSCAVNMFLKYTLLIYLILDTFFFPTNILMPQLRVKTTRHRQVYTLKDRMK
jgi:hypothetical protein